MSEFQTAFPKYFRNKTYCLFECFEFQKVLSLFNVVRFSNSVCNTTSDSATDQGRIS